MLVKDFFEGDKYAGNRKAITKYAEWATRSNGPGIWGKPTPINCVVDDSSPEYIVSHLLFTSAR